jgi:hypothetical protein
MVGDRWGTDYFLDKRNKDDSTYINLHSGTSQERVVSELSLNKNLFKK